MNNADIAALLAFLFTGLSWAGSIFMKYRLQVSDPPVYVAKMRGEAKAALSMFAWIIYFLLFSYLLS